jgi:hypothetical protein
MVRHPLAATMCTPLQLTEVVLEARRCKEALAKTPLVIT